MNFQGKRVLVTGAGGFIGSHLAERLVELGADVRSLVRYNSSGHWGWLEESRLRDEMEVVAGDICDPSCVRNLMRDREVVFHLAALIAIPYSYSAPLSYVSTNVGGTANVLEAAREFDTLRVVQTSTSEVYGTARYVPIDEEHPLQGQSPYSASKIGADKLAEAYHRSFNVPVVTVRPFNTFGPRQSARAVVPTIIAQCLARDTVQLGSLTPTRDLNYVENTVEGFIMAAAAPEAVGKAVNLGTGREISIGELARLICEMTGHPVAVESESRRQRPTASEVERLQADTTLAAQLIGWRAAIDLEEGLRRTIEWMRENLQRYRPDVYSI